MSTKSVSQRLIESMSIRRAELVALGSTTVAFALTVVLAGSAYAVESNPLARALLDSLGWVGAGSLALVLEGVIFAGYRRLERRAPRAALAGGWLVATIGVGDVLVNVWVLSTVGVPGSLSNRLLGAIALVSLVAVVVAFRETLLECLSKVPRPSPRGGVSVATITFSLLVVLSTFSGGLQIASPAANGAATTENVEWSINIGTNTPRDLTRTSDGVVVSSTDLLEEYDQEGNLSWKNPNANPYIEYHIGYDSDSDTIVATDNGNGTVDFIDGADGGMKNEVPVSGSPQSANVEDGVAVAMNWDSLSVHDAATGEGLEQAELADTHHRAGDIYPSKSEIYVGNLSTLKKVDYAGNVLDSKRVSDDSVSGVEAIESGDSVVFYSPGNVGVVDTSSWSISWRYNPTVTDMAVLESEELIATLNNGTIDIYDYEGNLQETIDAEAATGHLGYVLELSPESGTIYAYIASGDTDDTLHKIDTGLTYSAASDGPSDYTQTFALEDRSGLFPPDRSTITVSAWSPGAKSLDAPSRSTEWSHLASTSFNANAEASVDLVDGDYYKIEVSRGGNSWQILGYLANESRSTTQLVIKESRLIEPETTPTPGTPTPTRAPLTPYADGSTPTPYPTPVATAAPAVEGPAVLGTCAVGDKQGIQVEYWDPGYETRSLSANLSSPDGTVYQLEETFEEPRGYYRSCLTNDVLNGTDPDDVEGGYTGEYTNGTDINGSLSWPDPADGVFGGGPVGSGGGSASTATTVGGYGLLVAGAYLAYRRFGNGQLEAAVGAVGRQVSSLLGR